MFSSIRNLFKATLKINCRDKVVKVKGIIRLFGKVVVIFSIAIFFLAFAYSQNELPVKERLKENKYLSKSDEKGISPKINRNIRNSEVDSDNVKLRKYSEKIDSALDSVSEEEVNVIIEAENDDISLKPLSVNDNVKRFQNRKFQSIRIQKNKIGELEKLSSIRKVWLEKKYNLHLDLSISIIHANSVWNTGFNGSGIKVCVLDTGINKNHTALKSSIIAEKDFVTNDADGNDPNDFYGHGTHVAGIIASNNNTFKGVAYGASILNAKVFDSSNLTNPTASDQDIASGIDWCISQGANILTMSLGATYSNTIGSDFLSQYADSAVDQGKIVTISAGNSGPSSKTINCPGCAHKVITVGSTKNGRSGTSVDLISSFSSRGSTTDKRSKPDLVAPGQIITSTVPSNGCSLCDSSGFASLSGTSMATPMVAGLAALLLQARASLSPEEMKALLMDSAWDYDAFGPSNNYGAGRINASRAFNEVNYTNKGTLINVSIDTAHNIYVPNGTSEIRVTLYWPENYSQHNDVDLYVLDPAGNTIDSSTSAPDVVEMTKISNPSVFGWWKILVSQYNVTGNQKYAVASNFLPSEQLFLRANLTLSTSFHKLNVTNSSQIKAQLDWNSSNQNLDFYLYNTSGNLKAQSVGNNTNFENLTFDTPEAGTWLIVISNLNNKISTQYSLSSSFQTSPMVINNQSNLLSINSPSNNTFYSLNSTLLNVTVNGSAKLISGFLDNVLMSNLCTDCNASTSTLSLSEGLHNLTIFTSDLVSNMADKTISLIVDTNSPTIINYSHANGTVINGKVLLNLSINYTEANLNRTALRWKNASSSSYNEINLSGCLSGTNMRCSQTINLTSFDDSVKINYYFNLTDIVNHSSSFFNPDGSAYTLVIDNNPPSVSNFLTNDSDNIVIANLLNNGTYWA